MFSPQEIVIEHFIKELDAAYRETYTMVEPQLGHVIRWVARLALENIANSDALYHNVEHTIMVTLVGQSILRGRHLAEGGITPSDWLHFMMAVLCHDIGYVRGVCRADTETHVATGIDDQVIALDRSGTDAALTPYHVDRSKLFVNERFGQNLIADVNAGLICSYIEMTRFPVPADAKYQATNGYPSLVRAADFIGQLGDPSYLRKVPALYYEFAETGVNAKVGYDSPNHMRQSFTHFYWNVVRPYIPDALEYLNVTQEGRQWIAHLNSHVFAVEHGELSNGIRANRA